eukprot:2099477-Rhodomonas_salina.3
MICETRRSPVGRQKKWRVHNGRMQGRSNSTRRRIGVVLLYDRRGVPVRRLRLLLLVVSTELGRLSAK